MREDCYAVLTCINLRGIFMNEKMIEIGKVVNTHALRGEIKIQPWCDDPVIYQEIEHIYINNHKYQIEKARFHKNFVIAKLEGLDDINDAQLLKNFIITVERSALGELPDGVYYISDLLGSRVETLDGKYLGIIDDVIKTGSNDVYMLKDTKSGKPILIPVLPETIKNVDVEEKIIKVELLKGLVDENEI